MFSVCSGRRHIFLFVLQAGGKMKIIWCSIFTFWSSESPQHFISLAFINTVHCCTPHLGVSQCAHLFYSGSSVQSSSIAKVQLYALYKASSKFYLIFFFLINYLLKFIFICIKVELLGRIQTHICSTSTVFFDLIDWIFHFVFLI